MQMERKLLTPKEAAEWASKFLNKIVTPSNIQYLVQYAKIKRFSNGNGSIEVDLSELKDYYENNIIKKQEKWNVKLGSDLNWNLSFANLRESDTTKHVHRLHPYKGKFIPQLVEYFLDSHLNTFKKRIFFKEEDIILDPFMGSGTTLIQSSELGLHSIGIDVSEFNCLISQVKLGKYDGYKLSKVAKDICFKTREFSQKVFDDSFDTKLKDKLNEFNKKFFPNPDFKNKVRRGDINEKEYGEVKLKQFLEENKTFFENNGTKDRLNLLDEKDIDPFLSKWFPKREKQELFYYLKQVEKVEDEKLKNVTKIILSRTARSCRATMHSDLVTLKEPQIGPYYCRKHKKLCVPINSIIKHLIKYTYDTTERIEEFSKLRKNVHSEVIHGDSRKVDILNEIKKQNPELFRLLKTKKIDGVFTSPPYVGQIDYHEQHAYAYELFNIKREDEKEIGPLSKGQGEKAKQDYVEGISDVFRNISKFVKDDGDFFIVANDKHNLYPLIAEKCGLKIVDKFKRPVLNRTERDRQPYAEIIFHMKKA